MKDDLLSRNPFQSRAGSRRDSRRISWTGSAEKSDQNRCAARDHPRKNSSAIVGSEEGLDTERMTTYCLGHKLITPTRR